MIENNKKKKIMTIYEQQRGKNKCWRLLKKDGLRSNVHIAETARQIYKMHKNPTKQTLRVDLCCMKSSRFLDF